jgi:tetratricopeptide (TPR) repeat protein
MNTIARLKAEARRHEQAEDWARAIDAYARVIQLGEQPDGDGERELPLFNRIGDLFVRMGRPGDAVSYYEDAADRYAEAGLYNNAIALCNKALRYVPDRVELYRKLGMFSAAQGFLTDSRRWFLDYAEAMFRQGREDDAFAALGELAGLSEDAEMRLLLGRKLAACGRTEDAVTELIRAYGMYIGADDAARAEEARAEIMTLDPLADPDTAVALAAAMAEIGGEAGDGGLGDVDVASGVDAPADPGGTARDSGRSIGAEATAHDAIAADDIVASAMPGLEATAHASPGTPPVSAGQLEGFEATDLGAGALPHHAEDSAGRVPDPSTTGGYSADAVAPPAADGVAGEFDLPQLEMDTIPAEETSAVFDRPAADFGEAAGAAVADTDLHAGLASAWHELEAGRTDAARASLDSLHERLAAQGQFLDAAAAMDARIELDADALPLHRLRVEYAQQSGDMEVLASAYQALAAALTRAGAARHAGAVRQQLGELVDRGADTTYVAETSGTDAAWRSAPPGDAVPPAGTNTDAYVDLAAMLAEERPAGTRFSVEEKSPTGDEDLAFADLLAQFKTKLSENLDHEDAGSHYDLGLAFKEMGLLDEAISAFQVALRTGDGRLRILEELGQCFLLKGQHGIALKVLQRALEQRPADELELIGVYYYLGRAAEAGGQRDAARDAYERVLALELGFQDVELRLARL